MTKKQKKVIIPTRRRSPYQPSLTTSTPTQAKLEALEDPSPHATETGNVKAECQTFESASLGFKRTLSP